MWQLVKRDYHIILYFILFAVFFKLALFVLAAISTSTDNMYYFSFILMMLYAVLFYIDDNAKIMRTILSLPIKKRQIIMSRYLSLYTIGLILLAVGFMIDYLIDPQSFHFIIVYVAFCAFTLYIALSTPIYYLFKRLWARIVVHYFLIIFGALAFALLFVDPFDWFTGILNVAFTILDYQPIVTSLLFLMIMMYLSYRISYFIFCRKDVQ